MTQAKQVIDQTLQHWRADSDLAGLCDAAMLAKLPGDQKACRALWAEVNALVAKARGSNPKSGHGSWSVVGSVVASSCHRGTGYVRLRSYERRRTSIRRHPPPC